LRSSISPTARGDAGYERYATFFKKFYSVLPDDGRMLLHTIIVPNAEAGQGDGPADDDDPVALHRLHLEEDLTRAVSCPWSSRSTATRPRRVFKIERHHFIGKELRPGP